MSNELQTEFLAPEAPLPPRATTVADAPAHLCGRPIGEILAATASLAPEKIDEALALQRGEQAGTRLGEILVRMKAVGELDVLRALAVQLDIPFLERIDLEAVPGELAAKVPIHFAKQA